MRATVHPPRAPGGLAGRLRDWRDAGLLTDEQLRSIAAYEQQRQTAPHRRTVFAEALGYVGAALALGAVALLVGEFWPDFTTAAQLVLIALLTLALLGAGLALRSTARAPLQRLASVLLLGTVVGTGWFAGLVAGDLTRLDEAQVALVVGAAALVAALPLYLIRRRALAQLAMLGATLVVVTAALNLPALPPHAGWIGLTVATVGGAWFVLGAGAWLEPRPVAEVAGAVVALLACQAPWEGREWLLLLLGVVLAGGLVALAVLTDALHLLVVGALGLFLLVPRLVFAWFGDAIGGPASMLVVGLLLILLAVGIGRARREIGDADVGGEVPR
ncbi:DUF2157 domain-containing protein [Egicoccus sp. AB-alg2]|uniref:DUF2157 domain-containing protein n=1 Tax=Egicoccus sp. AB-alg2 TaxID=3242693 RepID=UPI00359D5829